MVRANLLNVALLDKLMLQFGLLTHERPVCASLRALVGMERPATGQRAADRRRCGQPA